MTKKQLNALEKIFAEEIFGRPFQSKAKIYEQLEQDGYCERITSVSGYPPLVFEEIILTHRGRIAYCESCEMTDEELEKLEASMKGQ